MNVRQLFPSPWISHEDLGNKRFELTVRAVTIEEMHDRTTNKRVSKPVVAFAEAKKRLIINKTQALALAAICGSDETGDWTGCKVSLRAGRAPNGKPTIVVEAASVPAPAPQLDAGHGNEGANG